MPTLLSRIAAAAVAGMMVAVLPVVGAEAAAGSPEGTVTPVGGPVLHGVVRFEVTGLSPDVATIVLRDGGGAVISRADRAPWTLSWDTRGLDGIHWLTVQITGRDGKVRNRSYLYPIDNAGPTVTSITPAAGALVRGTFHTGISAADANGIASTTVKGGKKTGSPYVWIVTSSTQGPVTVEWTLSDKLGNRTVARRTVVNDTVKPIVKITKAPKNQAKLTRSVAITAAATDRNGIARVQLLVNGKVAAVDRSATYRFTLDPKKYGRKFQIQLRAYDRAGNVSVSSSRTYRR